MLTEMFLFHIPYLEEAANMGRREGVCLAYGHAAFLMVESTICGEMIYDPILTLPLNSYAISQVSDCAKMQILT